MCWEDRSVSPSTMFHFRLSTPSHPALPTIPLSSLPLFLSPSLLSPFSPSAARWDKTKVRVISINDHVVSSIDSKIHLLGYLNTLIHKNVYWLLGSGFPYRVLANSINVINVLSCFHFQLFFSNQNKLNTNFDECLYSYSNVQYFPMSNKY